MNRLKRFFNSTEADAILLFNGDAAREPDPNLYYFAGFAIDSAFFIASRESEPVLVVSPMGFEMAREKFAGRVEKAKGKELWRKLAGELKKTRLVGLDKRFLDAATYCGLSRLRKRFQDVSRELQMLRAVKEEGELRAMRKACAVAKAALESVRLKAGKTEERIAAEIEMALLENGAGKAFSPIVASGLNSRFPHATATGRKWRDNEILLVDFGARWNGYNSDFTRCFFSGSCREERRAYEKLEEAFRALVKKAKPGIPAARLAAAAVEFMDETGFPEMTHSVGHGVGLEVHEEPSLKKSSKSVLRKGNVVAIEPAFYGKKWGARFEETIFI